MNYAHFSQDNHVQEPELEVIRLNPDWSECLNSLDNLVKASRQPASKVLKLYFWNGYSSIKSEPDPVLDLKVSLEKWAFCIVTILRKNEERHCNLCFFNCIGDLILLVEVSNAVPDLVLKSWLSVYSENRENNHIRCKTNQCVIKNKNIFKFKGARINVLWEKWMALRGYNDYYALIKNVVNLEEIFQKMAGNFVTEIDLQDAQDIFENMCANRFGVKMRWNGQGFELSAKRFPKHIDFYENRMEINGDDFKIVLDHRDIKSCWISYIPGEYHPFTILHLLDRNGCNLLEIFLEKDAPRHQRCLWWQVVEKVVMDHQQKRVAA
jgi:putative heme degradation protein